MSATRSFLVLTLLGVALSCVAPAVVPPAVPLPNPAPPAPRGSHGETIAWSFDAGLDGWTQERGPAQPVCSPIGAESLPASIRPTLGGDYWRTPIDIGQDGPCRVDTSGGHAPSKTVSPTFTIREPYLSMLVGRGGTNGTRVRLQVLDAPPERPFEERGSGLLQMTRVVWDVRELEGERARLVVEDDAGDGIEVDDIYDSAMAPVVPPPRVWGFADTHAHPVAQLGFGRHVFVGENDGECALKSCEVDHGANGDGGEAGFIVGFAEPSFNRLVGHRPTGAPDFDGWPRWSTMIHQQMYFKWIERAWQGGLRLLVAHAVNNEQLAANLHGIRPFDDMSVAEVELAAIKALADRHSDFMEIAYTPADARRIIMSGRLAVVLGVEADALGNCRRDEDCDEITARQAIDRVYEWGARHVFPVHLADNAFGGSAVFYDGSYDLLTWFLRGTYQEVAHDDGVAFSYSLAHQGLPPIFAELAGLVGLVPNLYGQFPYNPPLGQYQQIPAGHVNARGITPLGTSVLLEMQRLGIIVDVDHMGERARAETLALFSTMNTPVAMGHTWLRDLAYAKGESADNLKVRNDIMKTADEIEAVRRLGGVVSPITNQHDVRRAEGSGEGNDCEGSSTSWLQAYVYLVERMQTTGVGVGTDFNGLPKQPLQRFGPYACSGRVMETGGADSPRRAPGLTMRQTVRADADAQTAGVTYDRPIAIARANRFWGPLSPDDGPYMNAERAIWLAVGHCKVGDFGPPDPDLKKAREVVAPVANGLCGRPQAGEATWWRAATLVHQGGPRPPDPGELQRHYDDILGIVNQWARMESGNQAYPLKRSFIDEERHHDMDINLDGLAEYGLLPDFLQDVSNQLRQRRAAVSDLSAAFRSAESYIEMWERVEAARQAPYAGP